MTFGFGALLVLNTIVLRWVMRTARIAGLVEGTIAACEHCRNEVQLKLSEDAHIFHETEAGVRLPCNAEALWLKIIELDGR